MPGLLVQPRVLPAGTKQHSDSATEFEYYINRVSEGKARRMGSSGYHFATKESQPVFKEGRMNRVLIYPGAFNPPHRGHLLVLQHGFRECGEDFNVVAAIVLLKDDSYLSYKNSVSDRELLHWAWTLTDDQHSSIDGGLQEELTRLASLDGFDVEFVMLIGPDNFSQSEKLYRGGCYSDKRLISTAARAPEGYNHLSGPVKISNCTVWAPLTPHHEKSRVEAQSPSWLYTDEPSPLPAARQNETRIWECHAHGDVGLSIRFLYTPPALPDGEATKLVSGTAIHKAIMTTTKEESTRYIDSFALGATYLKQQLSRRDDRSHAAKLELLKAEKSLKHLAFEDLKSYEEKTCHCEDDECDWWCDAECDRRRQAERQEETQREAAGMPFEDLMRTPLPLEAAQSKKLKKVSAGVKEKGAVTEAVDEDSDELDVSFEETMRLRAPMKSEAGPEHKPEYRNANQWS